MLGVDGEWETAMREAARSASKAGRALWNWRDALAFSARTIWDGRVCYLHTQEM